MKPIAEQTARSVSASFGLNSLPFDVETLAQQLGVSSIKHVDLVEDGRLERVDGHSQILIRAGISAERARFTIAHELAHLILSEPSSDLIARRHKIGHDQEERFCEDFAAALLLPRDWVRGIASGRPRSLHTLRIIAGRSNTSLAAACVRLNEVAEWQRTLLHWRLANGRWGFRWAAGLPLMFDRQIRTSDDTRSAIKAAAKTGGDLDISLPIRLGPADYQVPAQMSVRRGSALALAQLGLTSTPANRQRTSVNE